MPTFPPFICALCLPLPPIILPRINYPSVASPSNSGDLPLWLACAVKLALNSTRASNPDAQSAPLYKRFRATEALHENIKSRRDSASDEWFSTFRSTLEKLFFQRMAHSCYSTILWCIILFGGLKRIKFRSMVEEIFEAVLDFDAWSSSLTFIKFSKGNFYTALYSTRFTRFQALSGSSIERHSARRIKD